MYFLIMNNINVYCIFSSIVWLTGVVSVHQDISGPKTNADIYFLKNHKYHVNTTSYNGRPVKKDMLPYFKKEKNQDMTEGKSEQRNGEDYFVDFNDGHTYNTDKVMIFKDECNITVDNTSIKYFQNILLTKPYLVQFQIFLIGNATVSNLSSSFRPFRWYWTPNTTAGPYPFLSWRPDYGVLSFGLLDTNTVEIPFVNLHVKGDCNFTFGTNDTSVQMTKAVGQMLEFHNHPVEKYPYSYFCYMKVREELINTSLYYASLYIIFPIKYISYNCCTAKKNFNATEMEFNCTDTTFDTHTWDQITILPFCVGLLLLLYCPIPVCDLCAWLTKNEKIDCSGEAMNDRYTNSENDWVFENGTSPLTFCELLSFNVFGLNISHPILVSRLRRFLFLFIVPSATYFQIFLYRNGIGMNETDKITIKELVDIGAPVGFLSILGNPQNRGNVFVPHLGGPVGLAIIYFGLGILFIVLPRNLKQIFEDGLPSSFSVNEYNYDYIENEPICSPLLLRSNAIIKASGINVRSNQLHYGYTKTATLLRCSIYMLFTKVFWAKVFEIQKSRLSFLTGRQSGRIKAMFVVIFPFYAVVCTIEICLCLLYYGFPFCFSIVTAVRGASKGLETLKEQIGFLSFIFNYRIFAMFSVTIIFTLASVFAYIMALIFLNSFGVLSQIFVLCFISIIIFPSVSFGYIFFFTSALYFCFHQTRNFGEVYSNLLSTAVEVSDKIEGYSNKVSFLNNRLILSNVRYENIKDVRINGKVLDISQNVLRTVHIHGNSKIRELDNTMGIPKKLFEHLINVYRPVHQQVLSLVFKVFAMAALIIVTLSITSDYVQGPTSEISEVMHVIFIVAVGTLPEMIEVTVSYRDDEYVKKEIEERKIEQTIRDFWNHENDVQN